MPRRTPEPAPAPEPTPDVNQGMTPEQELLMPTVSWHGGGNRHQAYASTRYVNPVSNREEFVALCGKDGQLTQGTATHVAKAAGRRAPVVDNLPPCRACADVIARAAEPARTPAEMLAEMEQGDPA